MLSYKYLSSTDRKKTSDDIAKNVTFQKWNGLGASTASDISGYAFPDIEKRNLLLEDRYLKKEMPIKKEKFIPSYLKVEMLAITIMIIISIVMMISSYINFQALEFKLWTSVFAFSLIGFFYIILFPHFWK